MLESSWIRKARKVMHVGCNQTRRFAITPAVRQALEDGIHHLQNGGYLQDYYICVTKDDVRSDSRRGRRPVNGEPGFTIILLEPQMLPIAMECCVYYLQKILTEEAQPVR